MHNKTVAEIIAKAITFTDQKQSEIQRDHSTESAIKQKIEFLSIIVDELESKRAQATPK